jgi:hypothetical protein
MYITFILIIYPLFVQVSKTSGSVAAIVELTEQDPPQGPWPLLRDIVGMGSTASRENKLGGG